jgi:hypothetical protein
LYYLIIYFFLINLNLEYIILNEEFVIVISLLLLFLTVSFIIKASVKNYFVIKQEKNMVLFLFNLVLSRNIMGFLKSILNINFFYIWNFLLKFIFLGFTVFLYDRFLYKNMFYLNLLSNLFLKLGSNFLFFNLFIYEISLYKTKLNYKSKLNNVVFFI